MLGNPALRLLLEQLDQVGPAPAGSHHGVARPDSLTSRGLPPGHMLLGSQVRMPPRRSSSLTGHAQGGPSPKEPVFGWKESHKHLLVLQIGRERMVLNQDSSGIGNRTKQTPYQQILVM